MTMHLRPKLKCDVKACASHFLETLHCLHCSHCLPVERPFPKGSGCTFGIAWCNQKQTCIHCVCVHAMAHWRLATWWKRSPPDPMRSSRFWWVFFSLLVSKLSKHHKKTEFFLIVGSMCYLYLQPHEENIRKSRCDSRSNWASYFLARGSPHSLLYFFHFPIQDCTLGIWPREFWARDCTEFDL